MNYKNWQALKAGDIIDIIAPSSSCINHDFESYIDKVTETITSLGFVARIPTDLLSATADPFSANSLEYRTNHLIRALNAPDSKAVWPIRGGYGAAKIIPFLNELKEPPIPKLILGFSDITALHIFLNQKWHWTSIHSPVVNQLIKNSNFREELKPILLGKQSEVNYNQLIALNNQAKAPALIKAKITGGNLSLVQTSIGTIWQIDTKDKILFLEDVGEKGYRIDRMLNHLSQAGILNGAKAIIFGEFTPGFEDDGSNLCGVALNNFANELNIPVLSLPIIGHNNKQNAPLPFGTDCALTLGNNPELLCVF